jgi:hypothetical protein
MKTWDEQELEKFIRENKDKFDENQPDPDHSQHFFKKLLKKFKEVISIVPYLVKVGIATIFVFILSFFVWKTYLCPPLTHISLKHWKVEHDYLRQIKRSTTLTYTYINDPAEKAGFESKLRKFDETYAILKAQLKENPTTDNVAKMLSFYKDELLSLEENIQNYRNNNPPH